MTEADELIEMEMSQRTMLAPHRADCDTFVATASGTEGKPRQSPASRGEVFKGAASGRH